jgi:hypothetical protein
VEMVILGGGESVIATETSTRYEPRNGRVELCVVLLGILADSA